MNIDLLKQIAMSPWKQPARQPTTNGPRQCCADRAVLAFSDERKSVWVCIECGNEWAVPHPPEAQ